jgi:myo-inositol-1(or 4)-monophosphatase
MDDSELLELLRATARAVRTRLDGYTDWRAAGDRPDQYGLDLAADDVAVATLVEGGVGVMSEESGRHESDRPVCVVVDPVDGSTNASHGIPWFATSLAAIDSDGIQVSLVVNQATGVEYHASRGGGAFRDGIPLTVSKVESLSDALITMNGYSPRHLGWRQYRALGAASLDLCLLAEGATDGYLDCDDAAHGSWDYLGGMLILTEAGGVISDADDHPLVVLDHAARRTPVAAGTAELHGELFRLRQRQRDGS